MIDSCVYHRREQFASRDRVPHTTGCTFVQIFDKLWYRIFLLLQLAVSGPIALRWTDR